MIRAGVIGWPIKHSLSPYLHGWWLKHYGIEGSYEAYPVEPDKLQGFIETLAANGFKGVNITVPHKQAVIPLLQELSPVAARMGAVNTVVVRSDGSLFGDNTDGYGFMAALQEQAPRWRPGRPAVILGAGGAARAVVDSLYGAGATMVHIVNRTHARAEQLVRDLRVPARVHGWESAAGLLSEAGLLVNTTVLGMAGQAPLDLSLDALDPETVVFDLVYNPLETWLVKAAQERGNPAFTGLGMLLHQAVPGFAHWFGQTPHVMPEQRAFLESMLK